MSPSVWGMSPTAPCIINRLLMMSHEYRGKCRCGNITFVVTLTRSLETYAPRACDCAFCTSRALTYLSDPAGALKLNSQLPMTAQTQGSGQAEFLSCTTCMVIVAVVYPFEAGLMGAVNASLIDEHERLQEAVIVSPKLLEPAEKVRRWSKLWFPVILHENV